MNRNRVGNSTNCQKKSWPKQRDRAGVPRGYGPYKLYEQHQWRQVGTARGAIVFGESAEDKQDSEKAEMAPNPRKRKNKPQRIMNRSFQRSVLFILILKLLLRTHNKM